MRKMRTIWALALLFSASVVCVFAQQRCGSQGGGALCSGGLCCSQYGYCGSTDPYCGAGCQSQCRKSGPSPSIPGQGGSGVGSIITENLFNEMLKHRNGQGCEGSFYTYNAFIEAARAFPAFGNTGDANAQKRELAAFFAQTSHETTGGWASAPDGPYAWGYCFVRERGNPGDYCVQNADWPCSPGRKYFGRGPIQISYNYNYGPAGRAIQSNLLDNPDLVATDPIISFKTALWFWMTPQPPKPSAHDVIVGRWTPSASDQAAGRVPGFGVITNIINGGIECGKGANDRAASRIGFYRRYCQILGVDPGANLECGNQRPFA